MKKIKNPNCTFCDNEIELDYSEEHYIFNKIICCGDYDCTEQLETCICEELGFRAPFEVLINRKIIEVK